MPTRWLRAPAGITGERIVVEGDDPAMVWFALPATLVAHVALDEQSMVTVQEVEVRLVRDTTAAGEVRAAVEEVTVRRLGERPVMAAALKAVALGELVDWMLTRAPVMVWTAGDGQLGIELPRGHRLARFAVEVAGKRRGKAGRTVVDVAEVVAVVKSAPARGQDQALREAFPNVGLRTLKRAVQQAREEGLLEHSARSLAG